MSCRRLLGVAAARMLTVILMMMMCYADQCRAVQEIKLSLQEEQPPRTFVGDLRSLVSSKNKEEILHFAFKHPHKSPYNLFSIVQSNAHLVTMRTLNRENLCNKDFHTSRNPFIAHECVFNLEVQAKPSNSASSFIVKLRIELIDINDHSPTFFQTAYSVEVNENSPVGSIFKLPLAVDLDVGVNAIQDYRFLEDSDSYSESMFPFSLVYDTYDDEKEMELQLKLIVPLDRELISTYKTVVVATDGGDPPKSGSMTLNIKILDYNDNSPQFDSVSYKVEVSENLMVGTTVMRVYAFDPDSGPNGKVEYKLVESSGAMYGDVFNVEADSGSIVLKSKLDYESVKLYQLVMEASDMGTIKSPPTFSRVTIEVVDENDNSPQITVTSLAASNNFEIAENSLPYTPIAYLSALDLDKGKNGQVSCSILDIIAHTGGGSSKDDDKSNDYYQNNVKMEDEEEDSDEFDENLKMAGSEKFKLNDINAMLLFRLEHYFNFDYKLESTKSLDREMAPYYKVAVDCSDHGPESRTTVVTIDIKVLDKNDNPPVFDKDFIELKVGESTPSGTLLTVVTATDLDDGINGLMTYDIEPHTSTVSQREEATINNVSNPDMSIVSFVRLESTTGQLFSASSFNFETMPRDLTYKITARDQGDPQLSSSIHLKISIFDEDDERPIFNQPSYTFTVSESVDVGQTVGQVTATDADVASEFNEISYTLASTDSPSFQIDSKSGAIKTTARLDRETKDAHNLVILASNPLDPHNSPSTTVNVSILVQDANDNPPIFIFPEKFRLSHIAVPLNAEPLTPITRVVATDIDQYENALIYYSIVSITDASGSESPTVFVIDRATGEVTNTVTLETEKTYRLLFLAEDGGTPQLSATAELLININGSLSGKGAALKSDRDGTSGEVEGHEEGSSWFGVERKYFLPMLLAMCCGAIGVLALVLAVAVVILCRKKRLSERKLRKSTQENNKSLLPGRNGTGLLGYEAPYDENDKFRWPEGAEGDESWKRNSSAPSLNSRKLCSSDKQLSRKINESKRRRPDTRCPGVGSCDSNHSCGEFGVGGGYTDCESCKESLATIIDDEICHSKAKSCCQVNQKLSKPSFTDLHPPSIHHHHPHRHRHLSSHRQSHHHQQLPITKHSLCQMADHGGRRGRKKTPRSRNKHVQQIGRGSEVDNSSGSNAVKVDDYSESDMSGSFYCDSGMDSDRVQPTTHSS